MSSLQDSMDVLSFIFTGFAPCAVVCRPVGAFGHTKVSLHADTPSLAHFLPVGTQLGVSENGKAGMKQARNSPQGYTLSSHGHRPWSYGTQSNHSLKGCTLCMGGCITLQANGSGRERSPQALPAVTHGTALRADIGNGNLQPYGQRAPRGRHMIAQGANPLFLTGHQKPVRWCYSP